MTPGGAGRAARGARRRERRPFRIDSPWRDVAESEGDEPFVVRLKAPREGETVIDDLVQGRVTVQNAELDDFVLLRSDGTPTYMLAVVVDDHDMGVTHVIRGDDHLNNAFRQLAIIRAMGWPEPVYAHVPLIHGPDGAKLSKRHGALGVDTYRDELGILPEALFNYLLRLGWGHGDDEIISREQAIAWFDLDACRQVAVALRPQEAAKISTAIISARPTTRGWRDLVAPKIGLIRATQMRLARRGDAGAEAAREGPQRTGRRRAPSCSSRVRWTSTSRRPRCSTATPATCSRSARRRLRHLTNWTAAALEAAIREVRGGAAASSSASWRSRSARR